jgi:hypothetical protein
MSRQLKLLGCETNHSARTSDELKNAWDYAFMTHISLCGLLLIYASCRTEKDGPRGALALKDLTGPGLPSGLSEMAPTSSSEYAIVMHRSSRNVMHFTSVTTLSIARLYRVPHEEMSIFWEVIVSVILSKKVYRYMCPIPNRFRDGAISLYSSNIVDKKETLLTVSNTGICCSSDKVGVVYLI